MARKRWVKDAEEEQEVPELDELIEKIIGLCREYGVSLSHEDYQGAFEFEDPSEHNENWLRNAMDSRKR
jgi:hypothetical protein